MKKTLIRKVTTVEEYIADDKEDELGVGARGQREEEEDDEHDARPDLQDGRGNARDPGAPKQGPSTGRSRPSR